MLTEINYYPLLLFITILLLIIIITQILFILPMKKRMDELSRITYMLIRKNDISNGSQDEIKEAMVTLNRNIKVTTDEIKDNIGSLSSSTKEVIQELKQVSSEPYMPTPNVTKMMRDTILELINMEVLLSHNMKIPNKESTQHIIDGTLETYPNVKKEYTIKLCLAMIENYALNASEKT